MGAWSLGKSLDPSDACCEAVVVSDHDGRIERLEIENDDWIGVKLRVRLEIQWDDDGRPRVSALGNEKKPDC